MNLPFGLPVPLDSPRPARVALALTVLGGCDGFDYVFSDPDPVTLPEPWAEEVFTQSAAPAVDVLFVVDGTGSMAEEHAAVAARSGAFLDALDALQLAWQVGVTTTDPIDAGVLAGKPWILTPSSPAAEEALALMLDVGTSHVPPSAGLDAAALALRDATGENRGFRRADAALHVIFLSDGDDESGAVLGSDPVGAFVEGMSAEAQSTGLVARVSAVVGDDPAGCEGSTGLAAAGTRYNAVASATGGVSASICDVDFGEVAVAIADLAAEWPTRFAMQAEPDPESLTVEVNGERSSDFALESEPPVLVFAVAPPPDAEIVVRYRLAEGE